jgi:hypothetical protein
MSDVIRLIKMNPVNADGCIAINLRYQRQAVTVKNLGTKRVR